jgi:DEAD/DEAH box helicase domain-containing protein
MDRLDERDDLFTPWEARGGVSLGSGSLKGGGRDLGGDAAATYIAFLKRRHAARITGELVVPPRAARCAPFPSELDPRLRQALQDCGIEQLYSHQREAWDCVRAGRDIAIVTPTASGKTLCYNLPVLDAVVRGGAKALYLFPTKALAQDQIAEILELNQAGGLGLRASTFDGDTPGDARQAVRAHGDVIITNPDMLHQAILPHHTKWARFFENLRFIVIDEVHTYRGVFGAHMANLLRRLQRILRFYDAQPQFIACSATIANPCELAERLIGRPVHPVQDCGAPAGARHIFLWNPPVINQDLGMRVPARSQTVLLARTAVKLGLKTIVFANSRLEVEVLTKYLKDVFDSDPRRPPRVLAYRGGYLPSERHRSERSLRAGEVDCVVTTSALELGVDIGALDVCILNGYPGSIAATLQRFGRAGRRSRTAIGVLVATSNLLDQYLARNPDFLLGASPERATVDPEQLLIQMDHVRCAAFELPFHEHERFGAEDLRAQMDYLSTEAVVHRDGALWHWIAESYPANGVSLRSVAEGNFTVIDISRGAQTVIGEVDYSATALTLYEGAIYLVQSRPWQVERLDWPGRKAYVRATRADYYTEAIDYTRLKTLDRFEESVAGRGTCQHGEVHLVRRVAGYKKIRYYSHENVGYGAVKLPDLEMHTTALWWDLPAQALDEVFADRQHAIDGLIGAACTLHHVAAMVSLAEARDLGRSVGDGDGVWCAVAEPSRRAPGPPAHDLPAWTPAFRPAVFLYDNYPGGIGLSAPLFDRREEIIDRSLQLIAHCPCRDGCPSCIGPVLPGIRGAQKGAPKEAAQRILDLLGGRAASEHTEARNG